MTLNINIKFSDPIEEFTGVMKEEIENEINNIIFADAKVYKRSRTEDQLAIKTSINNLKIKEIENVKKTSSAFFNKKVDFVQVTDT